MAKQKNMPNGTKKLTPFIYLFISSLFIIVQIYNPIASLFNLTLGDLALYQVLGEVHAKNVTHSPPTLENNDHDQTRNVINAVVHVGPYKTGTSTIQKVSQKHYTQLEEDNYAVPWAQYEYSLTKNRTTKLFMANHMHFAACFLKSKNKQIKQKNQYTCNPELLTAGLEIANQNKSILISAEVFAKDIDIEALSVYLQPWQFVTIVIYYRRFYDWMISYNNQLYKRGKIEASLCDELNDKETMQMYEDAHTYQLLYRFQQVFDNIIIMNMHDTTTSLQKGFYCDAIPDARNMCEKVKISNDLTANPSAHLEYVYLLNAAEKGGYIKTKGRRERKVVLQKLKQHQEETLKLSSDDFVMKCPSPKVLEELLERSLRFEKELLPDFYSSPLGEAAMRVDFEEKSVRKLCSIDSEAILETSPEWRDFFKSLNKELNGEA